MNVEQLLNLLDQSVPEINSQKEYEIRVEDSRFDTFQGVVSAQVCVSTGVTGKTTKQLILTVGENR